MNALSEGLEKLRIRDGQSVCQFARRIGVSDSTLILLRQGKRKPGRRFFTAVLTSLPEMRPLVMEYLSDGHQDNDA